MVKRYKNKQKIISLILALALICTIVPTSVYGNLSEKESAGSARITALDKVSGGKVESDFAYISELIIVEKEGNVWGKGI